MVVVNFRLEGALARKVDLYIRSGLATSKAEVIRKAIANLEDPMDYEDISDDPKLEAYLLGVKSGRIKPKFVGTDADILKYVK